MKTKNLKRLLVPWIVLFILGSLPACHSTSLTVDSQQPLSPWTPTATAIVAETETLAETSVSVTIVPSATPLVPAEAPVAALPPTEAPVATSPRTETAMSSVVSDDLVSITALYSNSGTLITPTITPSGTVILPTVTPSGTVILPTATPSGTVILPTVTPSGTVILPTATPSGTVILPTATPSGTVILPTATSIPACALYPIALAQSTLDGVAPGGVVADILNGGPPGNVGWLSWTGDSSAETLADSLTPPGDGLLSVGDWATGLPGVSNSKAVRDALDQLLGQVIVVPVWDQHAEQGANAVYHVVAFAQVQISDYQLHNENRISAIYLGPETCAP